MSGAATPAISPSILQCRLMKIDERFGVKDAIGLHQCNAAIIFAEIYSEAERIQKLIQSLFQFCSHKCNLRRFRSAYRRAAPLPFAGCRHPPAGPTTPILRRCGYARRGLVGAVHDAACWAASGLLSPLKPHHKSCNRRCHLFFSPACERSVELSITHKPPLPTRSGGRG